jgi:hypothetical protein
MIFINVARCEEMGQTQCVSGNRKQERGQKGRSRLSSFGNSVREKVKNLQPEAAFRRLVTAARCDLLGGQLGSGLA